VKTGRTLEEIAQHKRKAKTKPERTTAKRKKRRVKRAKRR
jgi:hypothetical protein